MLHLFKNYKHSIPIIFSHIENQYQYELSSQNKSFVILFTDFDYHFIAGNIPKSPEEILIEMRKYIKKHSKKEFILFAPNKKWENYLRELFKSINGVVDTRVSYKFDKKRFIEIHDRYKEKYNVDFEISKDGRSLKPFLQSKIKKNLEVISFANAFMIGSGHAEIDVWTREDHRKQGLAFEASLQLIKRLLRENLIPNWTTWAAKKESQMLANKLGFYDGEQIPAFIWVEQFGLF